MFGTVDGSENKLTLKKYTQDSAVLGPMQLDTQIDQDEKISAEIKELSKTGTKVTKDMVAIPVDNTILYVESIYQTMLNEESRLPLLKKIVVASGNKLAIGDNLDQAIENLLTNETSNIEIENTDDLNGLIDAVVKANKNLKESTNGKDWELMGSDIKKLQSLIDSLEKEKSKVDQEKIKNESNIEENNNINN